MIAMKNNDKKVHQKDADKIVINLNKQRLFGHIAAPFKSFYSKIQQEQKY